jgi:hypothetical protein
LQYARPNYPLKEIYVLKDEYVHICHFAFLSRNPAHQIPRSYYSYKVELEVADGIVPCCRNIFWYTCDNVILDSVDVYSIISVLAKGRPSISVSVVTRLTLAIASSFVCVSTLRNAAHKHCKVFVLHLDPASIRGSRLYCSCGIVQGVLLAISCQKCCYGERGGRTPRRCFLPSEVPKPCLSMLSPYIVKSSSYSPPLPPCSRIR